MGTEERGRFSVFAVAPPGFEDLLQAELIELGCEGGEQVIGGVEFIGGWPEVYRVNLLSRLATRILVRVQTFGARTFGNFRAALNETDWGQWLPQGTALEIRVTAHHSRLYHTGRLQEECAAVLSEQIGATTAASGSGDALLLVRLLDDQVTVSIDTSGKPLYMRGYRSHVGPAPLRENLAAALLRRAGWQAGEALLDPFCGSGVFLVEAASWAGATAPGHLRDFAFQRFPNFDSTIWDRVRTTKPEERVAENTPRIYGSDVDATALRLATRAARLAGVAEAIFVAQLPVSELEAPHDSGLVIANPPYGKRLQHAETAYRSLGKTLRGPLRGWRWAVIVANARARQWLGLQPAVSHPFRNGGMRVQLLLGHPYLR